MRLALLDRKISQAISSSAYQTLKRLIVDPSNPKFPPKWFSWSLRQALEREAIDSLRLMVMNGFDIEAVDGFMRTPLFYVCSKGLVATTKFLLNHGASTKAANFIGERPLHAACLVGSTDIVHWLTAHGADVNSTNCKGETPLHYACIWGETSVALALIAREADIWARNQNGETPLHYAISKAQTPIVSLLISTTSALPSTEDPRKAYREYVLQQLAKEEKYVVSLEQKPALLTGKFTSACARIRKLVQCAEMILELQVEGYGHSSGYSQLRQSILFSMSLPHAGLAFRETTISESMKSTAKALWRIPPQELSNRIDAMSDEDLHACLVRFRRGDVLVNNSLKSIGSTKWSRATWVPRKNVCMSNGVKVETTVHTYVEALPTSDINSVQGDSTDSFLTDGFSFHNINASKPDDLADAEDYQRIRSGLSAIDQTVLDGRLYSAVALNRLKSVKQLLLCGASPNFLLEDRSLLNQMLEQDRVKMMNLLKQFSFGS
jgi:ankyrin repeat protein